MSQNVEFNKVAPAQPMSKEFKKQAVRYSIPESPKDTVSFSGNNSAKKAGGVMETVGRFVSEHISGPVHDLVSGVREKKLSPSNEVEHHHLPSSTGIQIAKVFDAEVAGNVKTTLQDLNSRKAALSEQLKKQTGHDYDSIDDMLKSGPGPEVDKAQRLLEDKKADKLWKEAHHTHVLSGVVERLSGSVEKGQIHPIQATSILERAQKLDSALKPAIEKDSEFRLDYHKELPGHMKSIDALSKDLEKLHS